MTKENYNMKEYITIKKDDKYGDWDFSISALCGSIPKDEIESFRANCMVAFRVADNMWMRENETLGCKELEKDNAHSSDKQRGDVAI